jgi:hypothetical protein
MGCEFGHKPEYRREDDHIYDRHQSKAYEDERSRGDGIEQNGHISEENAPANRDGSVNGEQPQKEPIDGAWIFHAKMPLDDLRIPCHRPKVKGLPGWKIKWKSGYRPVLFRRF